MDKDHYKTKKRQLFIDKHTCNNDKKLNAGDDIS